MGWVVYAALFWTAAFMTSDAFCCRGVVMQVISILFLVGSVFLFMSGAIHFGFPVMPALKLLGALLVIWVVGIILGDN